MRWLDSTDGRDHNVSAGYIPIKVSAAPEDETSSKDRAPTLADETFVLELLHRTITVSRSSGLPISIVANGHEILAAPMHFMAVNRDGQDVVCTAKSGFAAKPAHLGEGTVVWSAQCELAGLLVTVHVTASYEG